MSLAAGRNGPTGGLLDAGHRRIVGGIGVEGQENGNVIICVEHRLDGPSRELDDLEKKTWITIVVTRGVGWTDSGIATRLQRIARSGDGVVD